MDPISYLIGLLQGLVLGLPMWYLVDRYGTPVVVELVARHRRTARGAR